MHRNAEFLGGLFENRPDGGRSRDPEGAGADILAVDGLILLQPVDIGAGLQQPVRHDEGIVDLVADQVAGRGDGPADGTGWWREQPGDLHEWAGMAGVIKMVLALRNATLPATLHADEPS